MKNTAVTLSGIIILGTLVFISCKKKSPDPEPDPTTTTTTTTTGGTTTGGNTAAAGFTYTPFGGAAVIADSAYYVEGAWGSGVRAFKAGGLKFEINITPTTFAAGSYTFTPGHGLTYVDGGNYFDYKSGTFDVTGVANNKASGNFSGVVEYNGGSTIATQTISLVFKDIPKK
jgi:hypothetical protein